MDRFIKCYRCLGEGFLIKVEGLTAVPCDVCGGDRQLKQPDVEFADNPPSDTDRSIK